MNPDLRLYHLLPALYRLRDTELGLADLSPEEKAAILATGIQPEDFFHGPLKSLLAIIADQMAVLEENLDQLYDDQFIETAAEWVVPYIGQLVGSRDLIPIPDAPISQRSEVANTIGYRRRKGTASVVEQLARDVTGWNANVVEFFQLLATTQYMNHLRPDNLSMTGLKQWEPLEFIGTPFDRTARTADVRSIAKSRGKHNIPNIGIFLWRLNSYSMGKTPAFKVDDRRYLFDPLGAERPLYSHPIPEKEITHLANRENVPMPLSRRILDRYGESYYGEGKSLVLYLEDTDADGISDALSYLSNTGSPPSSPPEPNICICDLSDVTDGLGNVIGWGHMPEFKIAIDPVLGRIAFPAQKAPPVKVETMYHYAFSAEMGGGGYEREQTFTQPYDHIVKVPGDKPSIQEALDHLNTLLDTEDETTGVVEIQDNGVYTENLVIDVRQGQTIELRSADKMRPIVLSNTGIQILAEEDTVVIFNGLLIKGGGIFTNDGGKLGKLKLKHCTLISDGVLAGSPPEWIPQPVLKVKFVATDEETTKETSVEIEKSILGPVLMNENVSFTISDSIVDAGAPTLTAYGGETEGEPGAPMHAQNTTFIGKVHTRILKMASNCIFYAALAESDTWKAPVMAQRIQEGCARFSWFPVGSRIPRAYNCQPKSTDDASRVKPMFQSMRYGDPAYCQLSRHVPPEIAQGADDGSEMGAFHHLYTPQRLANLRIRLEEYLRFGLEAGIFFAS